MQNKNWKSTINAGKSQFTKQILDGMAVMFHEPGKLAKLFAIFNPRNILGG